MDVETSLETGQTEAIAVTEPDWNLIRERYLQGEALADIAVQCGTTFNAISCRAYKEKWKEQHIKLLLADEKALSKEVRGNLLVSILRESLMFQRLDPSPIPDVLDTMSRCRDRLISSAGKLLGWDVDPVASAKPSRCLDV